MAKLGKQKLTGTGGMNMDTDENSLPPNQCTIIKNHINAVNDLESGSSGGQSTNALTPYPSLSTNFDDAYFPRLRSYSIDLSAITYPSVGGTTFVSIVRDTTEIDVGTVMTNSAGLSAVMVGLGFTDLGGSIFSITNTPYIYQKVIYQENRTFKVVGADTFVPYKNLVGVLNAGVVTGSVSLTNGTITGNDGQYLTVNGASGDFVYNDVLTNFPSTGTADVDVSNYYRGILFTQTAVGALNGTNTCIGAKYDLKLNQMVWFNYNSNNRHNIQLYNATTDTYTTVIETPLFNFSINYRISSINFVVVIVQDAGVSTPSDTTVLWVDRNNENRKLNIDRAIANEYWNASNYLNYTTDDEFMCAAKAVPKINMEAVINVDSSNNIIDGNSYQFAYSYLYNDGEKSKWYTTPFLTIAMLDIPQPENQFIDLTNIGAGSLIVSKINLAYRIGNTGDWRQFTTIDRSDWLSNTNISTYLDSYSPLTFKTTFKDSTAWSILDQAELSRGQDLIPQKSGAQELLSNNTILYVDNLEDYNNLSQVDIAKLSVSVAYGAGFNPASFTQGEKEALKGGGTYQFGLIMKDEFGRSSYVQTSDALSLYINTIMENGGLLFQDITFNFGNLVFPDWVKTVTLCRTKNLALNRSLGAGFIQWAVNSVVWYDDAMNGYPNAAAGVTKVKITLDGLDGFNTDNYNQTTTAYQFVTGDRITIVTCDLRAFYVNAAVYGTITKQIRSTDGISLVFDFDDRFISLNTA